MFMSVLSSREVCPHNSRPSFGCVLDARCTAVYCGVLRCTAVFHYTHAATSPFPLFLGHVLNGWGDACSERWMARGNPRAVFTAPSHVGSGRFRLCVCANHASRRKGKSQLSKHNCSSPLHCAQERGRESARAHQISTTPVRPKIASVSGNQST